MGAISKVKVLSGNMLKILACLFMLIDHIGVIFFPNVLVLRYIGRLAFPIFAYMIAEGCRYTRNKLRYFLQIFIFAVVWEILNKVVFDTGMNVFKTFSLSIIVIYCLDFFKKSLASENKSFIKIIASLMLLFTSVIVALILSLVLKIDYKFWGCMLPVLTSLFYQDKNATNFMKRFDTQLTSLVFFAIGLLCLATISNLLYQWYAFITLPILFMYSGKKGKFNLKYLFYIFYPAHIWILYLIQAIVG